MIFLDIIALYSILIIHLLNLTMSHNYKGAVTPHCLVVLFPAIEFSGYKKKLTAESSFHLHKILDNVFVALAIVIYKGLIPWMAYS